MWIGNTLENLWISVGRNVDIYGIETLYIVNYEWLVTERLNGVEVYNKEELKRCKGNIQKVIVGRDVSLVQEVEKTHFRLYYGNMKYVLDTDFDANEHLYKHRLKFGDLCAIISSNEFGYVETAYCIKQPWETNEHNSAFGYYNIINEPGHYTLDMSEYTKELDKINKRLALLGSRGFVVTNGVYKLRIEDGQYDINNNYLALSFGDGRRIKKSIDACMGCLRAWNDKGIKCRDVDTLILETNMDINLERLHSINVNSTQGRKLDLSQTDIQYLGSGIYKEIVTIVGEYKRFEIDLGDRDVYFSDFFFKNGLKNGAGQLTIKTSNVETGNRLIQLVKKRIQDEVVVCTRQNTRLKLVLNKQCVKFNSLWVEIEYMQ